MAYPSIISVISNPQASDRLNNPSHSSIHQAENTAITEIETFLGTLASVPGTLIYDIRSPNSNGGGHVQAANTGGTGQTTYTKGDLVVATSSSVLTKLAVGGDGNILQANSSTASGVNWVTGPFPKVATSGSFISYGGDTSEQSILSVSIPGGALGTSNAIRARVFVNQLTAGTNAVMTIRANYGTASLISLAVSSILNNPAGMLEFDLIAANSATIQTGIMTTDFYSGVPLNPTQSFVGMKTYRSGTSSVSSGATQPLGVTIQFNVASGSNHIDVSGYTVEKIS